jgi:hypothetical protein
MLLEKGPEFRRGDLWVDTSGDPEQMEGVVGRVVRAPCVVV